MANKILSSLSRTPPWPGMIQPDSFVWALRLRSDSNKSPRLPVIIVIIAKPIHFSNPISGKMRNKMYDPKMPKIKPPIVPSQVFLGEIFSASFVFPIRLPTIYAKVSLSQVILNIPIKVNSTFVSKLKLV